MTYLDEGFALPASNDAIRMQSFVLKTFCSTYSAGLGRLA